MKMGKNTFKYIEDKIGKHDFNLLIFGIAEIFLIFATVYRITLLIIIAPYILAWAFERVNKINLKKKK